jgi:putative hydrolase of HD superfamily
LLTAAWEEEDRRSGRWHAGVRDPESVAEHSLRVAQLAALIAAEEGGDPARAAYLGLWHDSEETHIGDIPHSAKPYITAESNEPITADQAAGLPSRAAESAQSRRRSAGRLLCSPPCAGGVPWM